MEEPDSKYTDVDAPPDEEVTARDTQLGPGTEVGGYIIDGELGHGGMGVVYSATHPVIGKRAAIKVLRPELSKQPIAVERFIREARAVNQIGHPNIVDIFAFDKLPDGRAYLVMDLLTGESLRKRLRRGPLHFSEGASVIDEIASALIAAHEKSFIHRDLKPDNVFLVAREGRWPEVKLLDFGLTKLVSDKGDRPFQTKTGVLLGTPDYMSPEQARGREIDYRSDIYALGVLMFEILAGRRPFPKGATPFETLQAHAELPVPSLSDACPALPQELAQLGEAMLAKNPEDRPSLAAVRTVIKRLRSNTVIPTMSVASLEIAVPPAPPKPAEALASLTASRVGAEPLVPSATGLADPRALAQGTGLDARPVAQGTAPAIANAPAIESPGVAGARSDTHRRGESIDPRKASIPPSTSGSKWPSTVPGTVPNSDPRLDPTRASAPQQALPAIGRTPTGDPRLDPTRASAPQQQLPAVGRTPTGDMRLDPMRSSAPQHALPAVGRTPTGDPRLDPTRASAPQQQLPAVGRAPTGDPARPGTLPPGPPSNPQTSSPQWQPASPQPRPPSNPQTSSPQWQPPSPQASPPVSALRAPGAALGETKLGVAPPRAPSDPSGSLARRPASQPPPIQQPAAATPRRSNRAWLVLGALLAIAAGVAIAIVLVGT